MSKKSRLESPSSSSSDDDDSTTSSDDTDTTDTTTTTTSSDDDSSSSDSPKKIKSSSKNNKNKKAAPARNRSATAGGGGGGRATKLAMDATELANTVRRFEPTEVPPPPPPRSAQDTPLLQGYRELHRNISNATTVTFPKGANWNPFQILLGKLPRGRHRCLDLFMFACEAFCVSLAIAFNEQKKKKTQEQLRRDGFKFKWMNSGPVAENFAVVCDQAKLFHSQLRSEVGPSRDRDCPSQSLFMHYMLKYLQSSSAQDEEELTMKTYEIKLKDWEKGGTRYHVEEDQVSTTMKNNFIFASADKRMEKLQEYIEHRLKRSAAAQAARLKKSGGGVQQNNNIKQEDAAAGIHQQQNNNNQMMMMMPQPKENNNNNTDAAEQNTLGRKNDGDDNDDDDENAITTTSDAEDDDDPLSLIIHPSLLRASATKVSLTGNHNNNNANNNNRGTAAPFVLNITAGGHTSSSNSNNQNSVNHNTNNALVLAENLNANLNKLYPTDQPIRMKIYQIVGGPSALCFPAPLRERLPEYVAHCSAAQDPHFRVQLLNWIVKSPARSVHQSFERNQGVVIVRLWIDELLLAHEADRHPNHPIMSKIHPETRKLTRSEREVIIISILERMKLLMCYCSSGTKAAWFKSTQHREDLNWLRKAMGVSHETSASKNQIICEVEKVLNREVKDLLDDHHQQKQQQQTYTIIPGGNSSSNTGIRQRSTSSVNSNASSSSSASPFNSAAAAARQHEQYKEERLKLALELRMSVNNNNNNNNNATTNNNNNLLRTGPIPLSQLTRKVGGVVPTFLGSRGSSSTGALQQQQQQQNNTSTEDSAAAENNEMKARFDEVYRPMPRGKYTDRVYAYLDGVDDSNKNDNSSSNNNKTKRVLNIAASSFDPLKLLGMSS